MDAVIALNRRQRNQEEAGIDWEQRRFEVAKAALPSLISINAEIGYRGFNNCDHIGVAKLAVEFADALISELKSGK